MLAAIGVIAAAASGAWAWTRNPGKHRTLPDMCAGVAAGVPGAVPGSCAWSAGGTSFTVTSTLFQRTRLRDAAERAEAQFRDERQGAINRSTDSGWPKAYREMPGIADEAFCLEQYDGRAYFVHCRVRDNNAILDLTAGWDDSTGPADRRDAVAQALTTFAPTAQRLMTDLVGRL
ncbi:hypothetical protein GCM10027610_014810 [Dactylosporangium cerinum]